MMWRINRERFLLLGGPAAAILQVAHPRVALGVAEHSDFRRDALGRLHRTLDAVYAIAFGTREEAEGVSHRVAGIHERVQGDAAKAGLPPPPQYSAFELDVQFWVLATLVATSVNLYERIGRKLNSAEKDEFLRDMKTFGEFFGLPCDYGAATWTEFESYYRNLTRSEQLASLPLCREIAANVARPRSPRWLWIATAPFQFLTIELLPEPLREKLGFRSTSLTRFCMRATEKILRMLLPIAPRALRFVPRYRKALRRVQRNTSRSAAEAAL
jgi:uncharacterized protein (DUF2236 family)